MPVIHEVIDSQSKAEPTRTINHNDLDSHSVSGAEGGGCEYQPHPASPDKFTDPTAFQGKPVTTTQVGIDGNPVKRSGK
jgi:hypothetical protein